MHSFMHSSGHGYAIVFGDVSGSCVEQRVSGFLDVTAATPHKVVWIAQIAPVEAILNDQRELGGDVAQHHGNGHFSFAQVVKSLRCHSDRDVSHEPDQNLKLGPLDSYMLDGELYSSDRHLLVADSDAVVYQEPTFEHCLSPMKKRPEPFCCTPMPV